MSQRTQRKPVRRIRPEPPRRSVAPKRRRGPLPGNRRRAVPWWAVALVALACGGILWLVLGQADEPTAGTPAASAEAGTDAPGEDPPVGEELPSAVVTARFPEPAIGQRLELRALSLGDDPSRCEAASLRVGGEVRTAYHHDCDGRERRLAFFLVRLTGSDADPVTVELSRFSLLTRDGRTIEPLELDDVTRRFPSEIALGSDVSRKGWVVFEDPGVPVQLRYADDAQRLAVRFPGAWL